MNKFLGESLIFNNKEGINTKDITYKNAQSFSPYIEINNSDLNRLPLKEIEVNPYYRFPEIFINIFNTGFEDLEAWNSIVEYMFNMTMHFFAKLDSHRGYYKELFIVEKLINELSSGKWGEEVKTKYVKLKKDEKQALAYNLFRFYDIGDSLFFFVKSIKDIIAGTIIYKKKVNKKYILYIGCKKTKETVEKLELIKLLFLPFKDEIEVYWENHFGVIDRQETMKIDEIAIF
ncbi:MAG: hypothetical protein PWP46_2121 [Fusobacteriaceae bacterium]|jgi:hypothetical protein|nr:hypothetical protein [Fusobacteriaceae bacterium]